jgi:hypothetical protein
MASKKLKTKQPEIEAAAFEEFRNMWYDGTYDDLRYGQAFFVHFKLWKMSDQEYLGDLYELDGDEARRAIGRLFRVQ